MIATHICPKDRRIGNLGILERGSNDCNNALFGDVWFSDLGILKRRSDDCNGQPKELSLVLGSSKGDPQITTVSIL
jgi:hypothetical protein